MKEDFQDWEQCLIDEVQSDIQIKGETLILRAIEACHLSRSLWVLPANQGAKKQNSDGLCVEWSIFFHNQTTDESPTFTFVCLKCKTLG